MKWFGCSGWWSNVFLYCPVSPPSLKATQLSLEAAIKNIKSRTSHLHTAENGLDHMEEDVIAFRSYTLTTGLTGCSSLVELWALLLWLEWREFWTKPCVRGQEMSETTEIAETFRVDLIFPFLQILGISLYDNSHVMRSSKWLTVGEACSSPAVAPEIWTSLISSQTEWNSDADDCEGWLLLWLNVSSSSVMVSQLCRR